MISSFFSNFTNSGNLNQNFAYSSASSRQSPEIKDDYKEPESIQETRTRQGNHTGVFKVSNKYASMQLEPSFSDLYNGSGVLEDPYQIRTIEDLQGLSYNASYFNKHFILINSLTFTTTAYLNASLGWKPIGSYFSQFRGSFNGNGKSIDNLFINRRGTYGTGLFGVVSGNLSNIQLKNVSILGESSVGGLVGYNSGSISKSSASGYVSGTQLIGGLVGYNLGVINNSSASGNVNGTDFVGGLTGESSGVINNSSASGYVNGSNNVGGLTGESSGVINNSSASGDVNGYGLTGGLVGVSFGTINNSSASGDVSGGSFAGGLTGYNDDIINNSSASGNIDGTELVGGLTGYNVGTIKNSSAFGDVDGSNYVGGLTGYNVATIKNSSAFGDVSGGNYVGGLTGLNKRDFAGTGAIDFSFASGDVNGTEQVGGLVGLNEGILSGTFAVGDVTATTLAGGLIGENKNFTIVHSSYATGSVNANSFVGGLVGYNSGDNSYLSSTYASGDVHGDEKVGGLAGVNEGQIINSYSLCKVIGSLFFGGLAGINNGNISKSYYDIERSGLNFDENNLGYSSFQLQNSQTLFFTWDLSTWKFELGEYPSLLNQKNLIIMQNFLFNVARLSYSNVVEQPDRGEVSWIIFGDINLDGVFSLYRNGGLILNNQTWSSFQTVSYIDDSFLQGLHNYTIVVVSDNLEFAISDTVRIEYIKDYSAPIISQLMNITYYQGEADNVLSWQVSDASGSGVYKLYENGILVVNGSWSSQEAISYKLGGLVAGQYNYTIIVVDGAENSAASAVHITILPSQVNFSTLSVILLVAGSFGFLLLLLVVAGNFVVQKRAKKGS